MIFTNQNDSSIYLPPLYGLNTSDFSVLRNFQNWNFYCHLPFEYGQQFNRITILGSGGPIRLTIPVKKHIASTPLSSIQVDYSQKWQNQHWRSLVSCYGKSPYFQYFKSELEVLFYKRPEYLADFTTPILIWIFKQFFPGNLSPVKMSLNSGEINGPNMLPIEFLEDKGPMEREPEYLQVFGQKFVPSLSILDALFCVGPGYAKM